MDTAHFRTKFFLIDLKITTFCTKPIRSHLQWKTIEWNDTFRMDASTYRSIPLTSRSLGSGVVSHTRGIRFYVQVKSLSLHISQPTDKIQQPGGLKISELLFWKSFKNFKNSEVFFKIEKQSQNLQEKITYITKNNYWSTVITIFTNFQKVFKTIQQTYPTQTPPQPQPPDNSPRPGESILVALKGTHQRHTCT